MIINKLCTKFKAFKILCLHFHIFKSKLDIFRIKIIIIIMNTFKIFFYN